MQNDGTRAARQAAQLFREAGRLIREGVRRLDVSYTRCGHCGDIRFNSPEQAKVNEALQDLPGKLRRLADRLDNQAMVDQVNEAAVPAAKGEQS